MKSLLLKLKYLSIVVLALVLGGYAFLVLGGEYFHQHAHHHHSEQSNEQCSWHIFLSHALDNMALFAMVIAVGVYVIQWPTKFLVNYLTSSVFASRAPPLA